MCMMHEECMYTVCMCVHSVYVCTVCVYAVCTICVQAVCLCCMLCVCVVCSYILLLGGGRGYGYHALHS